jgi:hypothetical protein
MKRKTFFYKFDRHINVQHATNHTFIIEENEARDNVFEIGTLLAQEWEILNKIDVVKESIDSYYEGRVSEKISYISEHAELTELSSSFRDTDYHIITVKFNKILSSNQIRSFIQFMGADMFRVSHYDSVIEIIINRRTGFFDELKELIHSESVSMRNALENNSGDFEKKYLFTIKDLSIDSLNRTQLLGLRHESIGKAVLVKINKKSFSRRDFDSLRSIYSIYKDEDSKVSMQHIKEDISEYLLFTFTNLDQTFYDSIITLFDSIISIEAIEAYNNYVQGDRVDNVEREAYSSDDIEDIPTVCIVDAKVRSDHPYLDGLISYWSSLDSLGHNPHGTQVAMLAAYGRLNWLQLGKPQCKIYNIESCNSSYSSIKDIIREALRNGIKIINISQWPKGFIVDNAWISELAKTIDKELVNEDILLILSAWNIEPEKRNFIDLTAEDSNINIPKDAVSCLVVGAKNIANLPSLYSRKNNISPVMIGTTDTRPLRVKDKKNPAFIDFWDNISYWWDFWCNSSGTSFAAPLLCNKAAQILRSFWSISTNTIKCLFINYSSRETYASLYTWVSDDMCNRHIWWWEVKIDELISNDSKQINIVIEDYISENEKKRYPIRLPDIARNARVEIRTALSYNSPISSNFHLKYVKFNVAAKLWSQTYEEWKNNIFVNNSSLSDEEKNTRWTQYKRENKIRWLNYFWPNQMWSTNCGRREWYSNSEYRNLQNGTEIIIEWHSRDGLEHNQKFSLILTIDISQINSSDSYIDQLINLNSGVLISGVNDALLVDNIRAKEVEFNRINNIQISVEEINFE